jgi:hypothetical protein
MSWRSHAENVKYVLAFSEPKNAKYVLAFLARALFSRQFRASKKEKDDFFPSVLRLKCTLQKIVVAFVKHRLYPATVSNINQQSAPR